MKERPKFGGRPDLKFDKIMLIICDQFRYPAHWGDLVDENDSLNAEYFPNYARLRDNGVEFKNAYIASAACNASRACIYTGKYGRETGVTSTSGFGNETSSAVPDLGLDLFNSSSWMGLHPYDPKCSLPNDDVIKTIGTHFRLHGYRAIYKGKWHLSEVEGGWPNKAYDAEGLAKFGFEGWNPPEGHGNSPLRWGMGADVSYVQDAVNSLYELKDTNHKWFMAVNLINPHDVGFFEDWPIKVPKYPGVRRPESFLRPHELLKEKPLAQSIARWYWNSVTFRRYRSLDDNLEGRAGQERIHRREWKKYANFYAHLAQIADFNMGILLDTLEATEQMDDTLVVFLSDHGEMGGAHGQTQKWYQAYEETIHVPLVFSNRQLLATDDDNSGEEISGRSTEAFASLIDIAPTLLSMAGINPKRTEDEQNPHDRDERDVLRGVDLRPAIMEGEDVQDAVLFVTDDDSVFSVVSGMVAGLEPDEQYIPENSKWKGMRESERKFIQQLRKRLENGELGGLSIEELKATPRFVRAVVTNLEDDAKNKIKWKLVVYTDSKDECSEDLEKGIDEERYICELYNLTEDPQEIEDLSDSIHGTYKDQYDQLLSKMKTLLDDKYYKHSLRVPTLKIETL